MQIRIVEGEQRAYSLSGKLTYKDNDLFNMIVHDVATGQGRTIVIDLSGLEFTDSFGIGLFLVAVEEAKRNRNTVVFRNPQGPVRRIFTLANLDEVLIVEGSAAEGAEGHAVAHSHTQPMNGHHVEAPPGHRSAGAGRIGLKVSPLQNNGDGTATVSLSGRFTFADNETFETLITVLTDCRYHQLEIEMSQLEFMDSAGLSMLLIAREQLQRTNTQVVLASPTGRVAQLLKLAAVDTLVSIRANV